MQGENWRTNNHQDRTDTNINRSLHHWGRLQWLSDIEISSKPSYDKSKEVKVVSALKKMAEGHTQMSEGYQKLITTFLSVNHEGTKTITRDIHC